MVARVGPGRVASVERSRVLLTLALCVNLLCKWHFEQKRHFVADGNQCAQHQARRAGVPARNASADTPAARITHPLMRTTGLRR